MGQAIGNIIYGISPDRDLAEKISIPELSELDGFTTYYSAHSSPIMVGAFIKSINECNDVDLTGLLEEINTKNLEYYNEFKQQRTSLLRELETVAEDYGIEESIVNEVIEWINNTEPKFKIVWSTS